VRTKLESLKTKPGDIKVLSPAPKRVPWTVDLEVNGKGVWQWGGFAVDSKEAEELALSEFYGPMFDDELTRKRYPVKVVCVVQVGV
jgi:hypothetical protein